MIHIIRVCMCVCVHVFLQIHIVTIQSCSKTILCFRIGYSAFFKTKLRHLFIFWIFYFFNIVNIQCLRFFLNFFLISYIWQNTFKIFCDWKYCLIFVLITFAWLLQMFWILNVLNVFFWVHCFYEDYSIFY